MYLIFIYVIYVIFIYIYILLLTRNVYARGQLAKRNHFVVAYTSCRPSKHLHVHAYIYGMCMCLKAFTTT